MSMDIPQQEVLTLLRQCHLFRRLSDEQLLRVMTYWQALFYEEGLALYEEGQDATAFFLIFSGRVRLSHQRGNDEEVTYLEEGDYFGEEALSPTPLARRATATAAAPLIVLRLEGADYLALVREFPDLSPAFRLILNSYLLASRLRLPWRSPREVVRYVARRHPFFLFLRIALPAVVTGALVGLFAFLTIVVWHGALLPTLLLILSLVGGLGWLAWSAVDWSNDYVIITNRRVVLLERVILLYESRQEVPLEAILADEVQTDQIGRFLNYGSLIVRTYTGQLILDRLAEPQLVLNLLEEQRDRARRGRRRAQRAAIEATIRSRLGLPTGPSSSSSEAPPEETSPPPPSSTQRLGQTLARLFMLREEVGDTIVYRTHWAILLAKTAPPTLALLVDVALGWLILSQRLPLPSRLGWIVLVLGVPALALWWLYQYVDWRNDRYIITPDMIIDVYKKPLGTEEKRSAPLRNIQTIEYARKTIIHLLLNFGTVYIRVGDTQFTFDDVYNPSEVQRELFQRLVAVKQREEQRAEQTQREQLAEWIELYHRMVSSHPPAESEPKPPAGTESG
ncbi:cyclic nucleotide-binding domain-containing protein [Thermanaerothrix sp. 4228-RoL]|uniref:Cyclic nucleotide-binding domain-containing protein n=1 Tax=Thermanaerothrix solaris TaxID=3058434 RepID=A0ABU3NN07_9CHLR|nr:cyclic nucleotide-binding domain-containing protein [Thermanaerothrix sp. 4228-RoL]MDT8898234.1 cyclic nucleotide-binding domain-containing protein [Thermanaerothrix sp. 4228-RoL]